MQGQSFELLVPNLFSLMPASIAGIVTGSGSGIPEHEPCTFGCSRCLALEFLLVNTILAECYRKSFILTPTP